MSKPLLYLHIGHGKVASSTIQAALEANADALRAQGCLIADEAMGFPVEGPLRANPVPFFTTMRTKGDEGVSDFMTRIRGLEQHRGSGRFQQAVISAENLTGPGMELIAPALRHEFEVRVLYYVRRPDDWMVSAWKQWGIKQGQGLAEFCEASLENGHPGFLRVAERWAPLVDSLRIRPLHPDGLFEGDIIRDLFHALDCTPEVVDLPQVNPSFDLSLLEVMADAPFLFDGPNDNRLFNHLEQTLPADFPMERAVLGDGMLKRIQARFEPDLRQLHGRFFPEVDFERVFGWREARPEPPSDALARVRRVLGLQLDQLRQLQRRIEDLESAAREQGRAGGR